MNLIALQLTVANAAHVVLRAGSQDSTLISEFTPALVKCLEGLGHDMTIHSVRRGQWESHVAALGSSTRDTSVIGDTEGVKRSTKYIKQCYGLFGIKSNVVADYNFDAERLERMYGINDNQPIIEKSRGFWRYVLGF